jgi:small subunit ribosomal protein S18
MQPRREFGGPMAPMGGGPGDRSGDRSSDRFGDRAGDRSGERSGDRFGDRSGGPDRGPGGPRFGGRGRDFRSRRKVCAFCVDHVREIDYKDVSRLRRYLSDRAKIEPRRKTGTCAKHQRRLSVALKNARYMAMLPYTATHIRGS